MMHWKWPSRPIFSKMEFPERRSELAFTGTKLPVFVSTAKPISGALDRQLSMKSLGVGDE
jgi:hypothetical protein